MACYKTTTTHKTSGQSEDDVMKLAYEIYFNDTKKNFTLDHAWRELRYDQKWCEATSRKGDKNAKRKKCGDGNASSQPIHAIPAPDKTWAGDGTSSQQRLAYWNTQEYRAAIRTCF